MGAQAGKGPQSTVPAAKSALQGPPSTALATRVALQGPQSILNLPRNLLKVHKVLHLPQNVHFKFHLPQILKTSSMSKSHDCTCHEIRTYHEIYTSKYIRSDPLPLCN